MPWAKIVEHSGCRHEFQLPNAHPPRAMTYTLHVNLTCEAGTLKDANDAIGRLVLSMPELFQLMSFSVWSPADGVAVPAAAVLSASDDRQAVDDEQLIDELREIARLGAEAHRPPPKQRPH
jgi:hypothetical protein